MSGRWGKGQRRRFHRNCPPGCLHALFLALRAGQKGCLAEACQRGRLRVEWLVKPLQTSRQSCSFHPEGQSWSRRRGLRQESGPWIPLWEKGCRHLGQNQPGGRDCQPRQGPQAERWKQEEILKARHQARWFAEGRGWSAGRTVSAGLRQRLNPERHPRSEVARQGENLKTRREESWRVLLFLHSHPIP